MGSNLSVTEMLAQLEAKVAYHKEQQELHAGREAFHAEQKAVHEAKYAKALEHFEAFKAVSAAAGEVLVEAVPPAAAPPDLPEDFRTGDWHWLSRLMSLVLEAMGPNETFGPTQIVKEIRERWGPRLQHKVDRRSVSSTLHRWSTTGRIHKIREGRAYYEALYRKGRPSPAAGLVLALFVLLLAGCAPSAPAPQTAAATQTTAAGEVTRLADDYVREYVTRFPEQAELSGLRVERHDGLTDNSLAALAGWQAFEDRLGERLAAFRLADFDGTPEWVTLGFLEEAVAASRQVRVCRYELWPVNQLSGWQAFFAQLADTQPVGSDATRADALARWSRLPRYLDNEVANLREGVRLGYTAPQGNVRLVVEQLDGLLARPVEEWPFYSPARRDGDAAFTGQWRALIAEQVNPAILRYRDFLRDEYLPAARTVMAIVANPNGEACYQASFRAQTTLDRPGAETYRLGRQRVERFLTEALAIGRQELGTTDLPSLVERLRTDPANKFASREELLAFARAAVERSRLRVSDLFSRLPKATMTVEPYDEMLERTASDSYWPAAEDGSRPATYRITLVRYAETNRSNAEITAFHEGYPGHHLQISLAQEQPSAHLITRLVGNAGFIEGWARYAEALAEEAGLYSTPYARANRRLWPSRGMVVDPGVHLFGWTREQAVAYMMESGRFGKREAEAGVDRIAGWPAQLTAYDTGAMEIFALREQAERELGPRFDLRAFHDVVLGSGAITLPMLRQKVESWIARAK